MLNSEVASTFNIYPASKNVPLKKAAAAPVPKISTNQQPPMQSSLLPSALDKPEQKSQLMEDYKKGEAKEAGGIPKLTIEVIRKRYLYPFSIDSNITFLNTILNTRNNHNELVTRLKQLGKNLDLVNTKAMQLPLDLLPANAEPMMNELQKPIMVLEDMMKILLAKSGRYRQRLEGL